MLQSMNIQFGNFIEKLMASFIEKTNNYIVVENLSGASNKKFTLSTENNKIINNYLTMCQTKNFNDKELEGNFQKLLKDIFFNKNNGEMLEFQHDVDLLFKEKNSNKYYYVEIKFNDDHDTDKFLAINRKFIQTSAYLFNELSLKNYSELTPILFYFNNKKMKGNIYVPERTNIRRGQSFFEEFLNIKYSDLEKIFKDFSEQSEIREMFDNLYKDVMKIN